jgi:chromosome partitioning protein
MRRLGLIVEKGGVGKTTCAVNLAVGLAKRGKRVLLVDCDPQANASLVMLRGQSAKPPTLAPVLLGNAEAHEAIRSTGIKRLDVLPSSPELAEANLELTNLIGRERRLAEALATVEGSYDVILLDTGPQRSLLSINALCYVSEVLIPVEPSLFSLSGLGQLQAAVEDVRRYLGNKDLRIAGLILSRVRRDAVSRDVEERLRTDFGPLVFKASIPASVKVEEAHSRFQSVIDHAPKSPGALAFLELVEEVIGNAKKRHGGDSRGADAADDAA